MTNRKPAGACPVLLAVVLVSSTCLVCCLTLWALNEPGAFGEGCVIIVTQKL